MSLLRSKFRIVAVLLALSMATWDRPANAQESIPGEYVVLLRKGAINVASIASMAAEQKKGALAELSQKLLPDRDVEITHTFSLVNAVGIRVPTEAIEKNGKRVELAATLNDNIDIIEPNFLYHQDGGPAGGAPADPELPNMWFLDRISADRAWATRNESPSVVVAVIDTGVFLGHEDLKDNLWKNGAEAAGAPNVDDDRNGFVDDIHGFDFFTDDPDPSADLVTRTNGQKEYEAHGTHVAGTIGAVSNMTGIVGISRRVQIMPLKFLGGPDGSGSLIDAMNAIDYAVLNGAHIINASWGGGARSVLLERAIERANSAGVLFIAAAGNGGSDGLSDDNDLAPHFPSSYTPENIIAVAATGESNPENLARLPGRPSFSNFGATSVDLAAPGERILSSIPGGNNPAGPTSKYEFFYGTSMATPVVSGAAALLKAEYPSLNHLAIRKLILHTVDPVPSLGGKVATGGRLNLDRALRPTSTAPGPAPAIGAAGAPAASPKTAGQALDAAKSTFRPAFTPAEQQSK